MIRIRDLTLAPGEDPSRLRSLAAKALHIRTDQIQELIVRKRSVDARHKNAVRIVYTVDLRVEGNEQRLVAHAKGKAAIVEISCYRVPTPDMPIERRPVVVGFGPGGDICRTGVGNGRFAAARPGAGAGYRQPYFSGKTLLAGWSA